MSDNELSDDTKELQELIAEYEAKPKPEEAAAKKGLKRAAKGGKMRRPKQGKLSLEVPMDKVLFGDKQGLIRNLYKAANEESHLVMPKKNDEAEQAEGAADDGTKKLQPAWIDSDDEQIKVGDVKRETAYTGPLDHLRKDKPYKEYLTARYKRIMPQPKWASLEGNKKRTDIDSDDEELLRTAGYVAKNAPKGVLRSKLISCKRLRDLNKATYSEGVITTVQFHPTSTAALVAGTSCVATIYALDGWRNEKLHSMRFENFPIRCARIAPCGTKAIFGSIRRYYYSYDLLSAQEQRHTLPRDVTKCSKFELSPCGRFMAVSGRFGMLHLFDTRAHELLHTFKQESDVTGLCFTGDSKKLICHSNSCNVSIFSLRQQRLEHSFIDEGCIAGSVLDLSPNQRLLATGSREGVVNVYDYDNVQQLSAPLPEKRFLNLTTAISEVKFNHSSELLAFSSAELPAAVKLAHFPSATVYANFPDFSRDIGKVQAAAFSPGSGYFALGTLDKKVPLFRFKHFKNY